MPMNLVIQEKRKELGLTQEQVAEYLNVSIPAVSKWEKGSTSPDISLLPPLARLLKIDMNTLLCFQEDLSQEEIGCLCREVAKLVRIKGISAGFEAAGEKIREYPHNETLLHSLTILLDGLLAMSGLSSEETRQYDDMLVRWYRHLTKSSDSRINNSANFMMVSRFIRGGDYEKAQEILDVMPDKEDPAGSMADKRILQVNIYLRQGKTEKAVKELQTALLMSLNKVQMLLHKMVDAELESGKLQTAKDIAGRASQMVSLFDLWEYGSFIAPLQIAGAKKNVGECVGLLRKMLAAMLNPWDMDSSPLFYRIAKPSDQKHMLSAVLSEMEKDPAYSFLQDCGEFKELIAEYKALADK